MEDTCVPQPHLTFRIDGRLHALDAASVREVLRLPELTPVAETAEDIVGLVNLRGRMVPVLDVASRLGARASRYRIDDCVIVLDGASGPVGLIVSEVCDVHPLSPADIEPIPGLGAETEPSGGESFVAGVARIRDEIVAVLRANAFTRNETSPSIGTPAPDNQQPVLSGPTVLQLPSIQPANHGQFCPEATPEERQVFRRRALEIQEPIGTDGDGEFVPLAVVRLSGESYAIDLEMIREFAAVRDITRVPCCPMHILGQVNLRGEIVTVVDIRPAINLPLDGSGVPQTMVVVRIGDLLVGVGVDEVVDILRLRPEDVLPVPIAVHSGAPGFLQGTARYAEQTVSLLDLTAILTRGDLVVNQEP